MKQLGRSLLMQKTVMPTFLHRRFEAGIAKVSSKHDE